MELLVLLPNDQLRYIIDHARSTYPEECCGLLIGTDRRIVERALAARNAAEALRMRRYRIDSSDLFRAREEALRAGLTLIGAYHSHPNAPVEPSQLDLDYAWPNFTYLVISLKEGEPQEVGAWSLNQTATAFEPEELQVYSRPFMEN
jgi:proteasome lid subunit RPN8/RPN11